MINKVIAVFIILSLILGYGSVLFAENITLSSGATIKTEAVEIPPEGTLYKEAESRLANIPTDFKPDDIIKYGWKENPQLENILKDNKEAINLFKKATLQKSDGFIFGKRPGKLNAFTEIPSYIKKNQLFKLLFVEARMYESRKQYSEAMDDYLAALRFMCHLSRQRFGVMMSTMLNVIDMDMIYPCLKDVLKNNNYAKEDYKHLLDILLLIGNNQDLLKTALEEERDRSKGTLRLIEESAKNGATFKELFAINDEQAEKYKIYAVKLNSMLDSDFFKKFYKQVDSKDDDFFNIGIIASKNNNLEIYEKKIKEFQDSSEGIETLSNRLYSMLASNTEDKDLKLKVADIEAKIFVSIGVPKFLKVITRYHVFYNKLNILIVSFAVKLYQLDNGALPDNLNQLVPKYLSVVPSDTFNNFEPLSYKKDGNDFIVSSVGALKPASGDKVAYDTGAIIFSSK